MTNAGFFLVVEGLDGAGKTTLARALAAELSAARPDRVQLTFEPHDASCGGDFIRQVLAGQIRGVSPRTLALAFAANRADHLEREILPFLAGGPQRIIVGDRYYLSSLVYQSGPDLSMDEVMALNRTARQPDLTLFLDAGEATCSARLQLRGEERQLFERNFVETRQKYLEAIAYLRSRGEAIAVVNADGSFAEVQAAADATILAQGPVWLRPPR
jgi:dTMP kinase